MRKAAVKLLENDLQGACFGIKNCNLSDNIVRLQSFSYCKKNF